MSYNQKNRTFKKLYRRYFKKILFYVLRILKNEMAAAEDITQEAFLRAYNHIEKLQTKTDFLRWIYTVARNLSYNYIRDRRYKECKFLNQQLTADGTERELQEIIPDNKNYAPDRMAEAKEFMEKLWQGLNELSLNYRAAVELCCMEDLSYKKAAVILNTSENVVAHDLMRGRKKLFHILQEYK